ncbi:MAG TPA: DNA-formamidopyrimidine glycosylase family protein [Ornithinimicrobium sp.]|uniref:Fpg/Nei family DNA glycosylase n=1 Tax=Ornithinimicrobium sp. TaxID=1977084 RepID=UPI002B4A05B1|nr:DNA-formamidopyrimidine glycosylase family protein [Ornithinimicrobium sp.]HKJ12231.1 DNA-formamidopyrimidine glycosylase family protein [Ornithinimicrobium sp.]
MPEGHTIHALARDLDAAFAGTAPMASSPQLRFADGAAQLDGHEVEAADAWGKHLFVDFAADLRLHVHLGLIGKFTLTALDPEAQVPPVRGQVRLRLETARHVADLRGPIICAVVTPEEVAAVIARQGPDPLRPGECDPERAWAKIHRSRRSIAELLMDQQVLAGVGNVYRSEVLFRHRVGPMFEGHRIKRHTWQALWDDLVLLMPLGVVTGRIVTVERQVTTVLDQMARGVAPRPGRRRSSVYKRQGEPCPRCGSVVRSAVVAGRNLFWCANCQRRT